ncbi:MAG: beta-ketoacyl synthase N-terminal-like domain-containing protein [Elainellaceae cyanobacterium]
MPQTPDQPTNLSPTKQALLAIKQLQAKLDAVEQAQHEPIAIVGMGCRFPGEADSPEAFWEVLHYGKDAITDIPGDRWDVDQYYSPDPTIPGKMYTRRGGFVPHLYEFDAPFFRIAPREAASLDPQQRLLLEVGWETLEHAGLSPDRLVGKQAGVFVGICSIDYWHRLLSQHNTQIDAYLSTGNTHSVAAGRLSYVLGVTGPSLAVDTACSSSLVAIHLACQSLRNRECNLALAGGVNRILSPEASINFSKAKMLSPTGQCRSFDSEADGFVRSEGCGMVALKRLSDAEAAGDTIWAVILGSAMNHDGRTSGLTVPNGPAQQAVIRQALHASRIQPDRVSYVETHGTGTSLGDPIEAGALGEVFGTGRSPSQSLVLGSVKTNIGHLEAAAGIAGLIKTVLAIHHDEIPANLHVQIPNPHIDWHKLPLKVPTHPVPWTGGERPRVAGVSAFGFSGTNAHVVVGEYRSQQRSSQQGSSQLESSGRESRERDGQREKDDQETEDIHLLTLSARTEQALRDLVRRYIEHLGRHPDLKLGNVCFTACTGRSHFNHRLAVISSSIADLREKLVAFDAGQFLDGVHHGRIRGAADLGQLSSPQSVSQSVSQSGTANRRQVLEEQAMLYLQGAPLDWNVLDSRGDRHHVVLPTYPFQRQRYGIESR